MGIITKIESQKKRDDRVNIYIDEKFFMAIYKELVFTFNLKKGQEIDPNNLKSILDNEMYMKAKNKALSILSKASQSEKQIRQKLAKDYEEDTIDRVIEFLQKKRLHFCKRFCDPGGTRTLDPMIKSHLLYQLSYGVDFLDGTGAKVTLFEKPANDYSKKFLATTIFDTPANDPAIQDSHLLPKPHCSNPFFPTLQTYKAPTGDYG